MGSSAIGSATRGNLLNGAKPSINANQHNITQTTSTKTFNKNVKGDNYITKRGWTDKKINNAINRGVKGQSINKANGNICSVYTARNGSYVVIDNVTRNLVQLSKYGDKSWIPDIGIIWF